MVRIATRADVPRMLELGAAMHVESRYAALAWDAAKVEILICALIDSADGLALVAEQGGEVVGGFLGSVQEHYFTTALVASDFALFVAPDRRGGMHAAALLVEFVRWARARGAQLIQAGITTGVHLDTSTRLFRAVGFEPVGTLFDYRRPE